MPTSRKKTGKKPITQMTTDELTRAAAEFDEEFVADTFTKPDPAARAKWKKARRRRGRPKVGKGVKVISVSLEQMLLARATRLAKKLGISRAKLIARGLHSMLAKEEEE